MAKLPGKLIRLLVVAVVAVVVAGGVYFAFFNGPGDKTVNAEFSSAVGVYPGTPVKILGVKVGQVESVSPNGGSVKIGISYDAAYELPKGVSAVLVANSLVSDRYVQLQPAYTRGAVLDSGGTITIDKSYGPAEIDDIYGALNTLSVALGPAGANKGGQKTGALSTLLKVSAANLKGNGAAIGASISGLSKAARTLANGRVDLFQTVGNLRKFTDALSSSDKQVRLFNQQLAQVSSDLANERADLGIALKQLGLALDDVNSFVKNNAAKLHTSITGLEDITNTLVKQKGSLNETLAVAPVALANIIHAYQPDLGVIATRGNLASLTDLSPQAVCAVIYTVVKQSPVGNVLGSLTGQLNKACTKLLGGNPAAIQKVIGQLLPGVDPTTLGNTVGGLLTASGGSGGLPGSGGLGGFPIGGGP